MVEWHLECPGQVTREAVPLGFSQKQNEILPSTTWMDVGGIMLSELSQKEKRQMPDDFTYMYNLKSKINKQKRNRLIDTKNILMGAR